MFTRNTTDPFHDADLLMDGQNAKTVVSIEDISIEPDRYGIIRPCLEMDLNFHYAQEPLCINLPSMQQLVVNGYEPGHCIELTRLNNYIIPGKIVDASRVSDDQVPVYQKFLSNPVCCNCHSQLQYKHSVYYCTNPLCDLVIAKRLNYASTAGMFDIPLDDHDAYMLYLDDKAKITKPLHWFFVLMKYNLDTIYPEPEIIQNVKHSLEQAEQQVRSCAVDSTNQRKLLDLFSIPGLHRDNIAKLQAYLHNRPRLWTSLYNLLIDTAFLITLGIKHSDAQMISCHAKIRGPDIASLCRIGQFPFITTSEETILGQQSLHQDLIVIDQT